MPAPTYQRWARGVIVGKVITRGINGQTPAAVAVELALQGEWIILRVAGDIKLPPVFRSDNVYPGFGRFGENIEIGDLFNFLTPQLSVA